MFGVEEEIKSKHLRGTEIATARRKWLKPLLDKFKNNLAERTM